MKFTLDPRLASDTFEIGDLSLSRALLMNDARYPWVILAPRRRNVADVADLTSIDRAALIEEVARACEIVRAFPDVEKVNVGALGNIVRQLHIHIVGRNARDFAWPGPVWGAGSSRAYPESERQALLARLKYDLRAAPVSEND
jgi:diadenosine tetraphosphate (Ap4A) HIT family hydrolase